MNKLINTSAFWILGFIALIWLIEDQCKGVSRDWILSEVQSVEGDEGHQGYRDEERETGDSRCVSRVWH